MTSLARSTCPWANDSAAAPAPRRARPGEHNTCPWASNGTPAPAAVKTAHVNAHAGRDTCPWSADGADARPASRQNTARSQCPWAVEEPAAAVIQPTRAASAARGAAPAFTDEERTAFIGECIARGMGDDDIHNELQNWAAFKEDQAAKAAAEAAAAAAAPTVGPQFVCDAQYDRSAARAAYEASAAQAAKTRARNQGTTNLWGN